MTAEAYEASLHAMLVDDVRGRIEPLEREAFRTARARTLICRDSVKRPNGPEAAPKPLRGPTARKLSSEPNAPRQGCLAAESCPTLAFSVLPGSARGALVHRSAEPVMC
jgi:hypothetical protein